MRTRRTGWYYLIIVVLFFAAISCVLPMVHILALSFSSKSAAIAGWVIFWPINPTLASYKMLAEKADFWRSLLVTLKRLAIGVPVNVGLCVLAAYPLSQSTRVFRMRTAYAWFFVFTMFFGGGLIPMYILVKELGMIDSIWALVLPGAVPIYHTVLLMNFFRSMPRDISESAFIDGAGHFTILSRIYIPISKPAMATIILFTVLGHWNQWMDGIIFMNSPLRYPLQSYLQTMMNSADHLTKMGAIISPEMYIQMELVSDQTFRSAQIFLGALPIMLLYPFMQRFFVKGIVIGSVKG